MLIGICDDLETERNAIKTICEELGENNILTFSDSDELFRSDRLQDIDLLFLDIELKDDTQTGIDIKNKLEDEDADTFIVFCTTHQELMPDAFGRNVLSFLNKPFQKQSIQTCIDRAAYLKKDFRPISINDSDTMICKDILYLSSEQKYTIFHSVTGSTCSSRQSLKEWASQLESQGFCQISRSTIINLKHYVKFNAKDNSISLHHGIKLAISRRYINRLKDQLHNYQIQLIRNGH